MALNRRAFVAFLGSAALLVASGAPARAEGAATGYALGDMVLGNENAAVTVIEYASLTCPHCAHFHETTFPDLKSAYIDTGKIKFVYRDFPLDEPALRASILARCAGAGRFFGFIDVLFEQQPNWARAADPVAALARLGRLGGVGAKQFDACMADRELIDSVLKSRFDAGNQYDINSTPSFIVNGKLHAGALTFAEFEKILQPLLTE